MPASIQVDILQSKDDSIQISLHSTSREDDEALNILLSPQVFQASRGLEKDSAEAESPSEDTVKRVSTSQLCNIMFGRFFSYPFSWERYLPESEEEGAGRQGSGKKFQDDLNFFEFVEFLKVLGKKYVNKSVTLTIGSHALTVSNMQELCSAFEGIINTRRATGSNADKQDASSPKEESEQPAAVAREVSVPLLPADDADDALVTEARWKLSQALYSLYRTLQEIENPSDMAMVSGVQKAMLPSAHIIFDRLMDLGAQEGFSPISLSETIIKKLEAMTALAQETEKVLRKPDEFNPESFSKHIKDLGYDPQLVMGVAGLSGAVIVLGTMLALLLVPGIREAVVAAAVVGILYAVVMGWTAASIPTAFVVSTSSLKSRFKREWVFPRIEIRREVPKIDQARKISMQPS